MNSFLFGWVSCICLTEGLKAHVGKVAFIKNIDHLWINLGWWVWFALWLAALSFALFVEPKTNKKSRVINL
jgi:hypothetical protein